MNIAAFEGLTALEIFRKLAPEFAAVPDPVVLGYIDLASLFVCEGDYGKALNVALALMAAHIMASPGGYSQDGSTSVGKILSRKEGDLSITYGSVSSDADYLSGTTYGNLLQMLRKRLGRGFALMTRGVVGGCVCP
ncbi:DUF4054 domain-containing protein [Pantoea sp. BAV 3049]|uniref:DUF4054 domain-containing protein n=1 Tax=Pantoea sp. BAV 3049 TaxID=2654188 RepID=UPI00131DC5C0|nr:DUF4054 domain-containing protein [Pantoea sp. BAV 3049]